MIEDSPSKELLTFENQFSEEESDSDDQIIDITVRRSINGKHLSADFTWYPRIGTILRK